MVGADPGRGSRDSVAPGGVGKTPVLRGVRRVRRGGRARAACDMGGGAAWGVVEVMPARVAIAAIVPAREEPVVSTRGTAAVLPGGAPVRAARRPARVVTVGVGPGRAGVAAARTAAEAIVGGRVVAAGVLAARQAAGVESGRADAVGPGGARARPLGHGVACVPVHLCRVRAAPARRAHAHRPDVMRTAAAGSGGGVADQAAARVVGSFRPVEHARGVAAVGSTGEGRVSCAGVPRVATGAADLWRHLVVRCEAGVGAIRRFGAGIGVGVGVEVAVEVSVGD